MTFREALAAECGAVLPLTEVQIAQLERHYELLTRWNQVLNLTRISGVQEVIRFHICESLVLGHVLPAGRLQIADVGSGGGFPGIPIGILRQDCIVSLIESHQRKAVFLREVARKLPNVVVDARRAEGAPRAYDWVVSRAVDPRTVLSLGLAPNVALLMAKPDLHALPEPSRVIDLPNSKNRIVAMFHVKPKHAKIDQRG